MKLSLPLRWKYVFKHEVSKPDKVLNSKAKETFFQVDFRLLPSKTRIFKASPDNNNIPKVRGL
jgi:hypothetical protein